jgi:PncC family amidohydrolase
MTTMTNDASAARLAKLLELHDRQLVLAESCTGGHVAACLTTVPGISRFFCGSVVSYQDSFKVDWLGIPTEMIRDQTSVSEPVTRMMAIRVLAHSARADLAAAVTGHLGPGVDENLTGQIFVAISARSGTPPDISVVECQQFRLATSTRRDRQIEASEIVLGRLIGFLESTGE